MAYLSTPSASHVGYSHIYEPADDWYPFLDVFPSIRASASFISIRWYHRLARFYLISKTRNSRTYFDHIDIPSIFASGMENSRAEA